MSGSTATKWGLRFVALFYLSNSDWISTSLSGLFNKICHHLRERRSKFSFLISKE